MLIVVHGKKLQLSRRTRLCTYTRTLDDRGWTTRKYRRLSTDVQIQSLHLSICYTFIGSPSGDGDSTRRYRGHGKPRAVTLTSLTGIHSELLTARLSIYINVFPRLERDHTPARPHLYYLSLAFDRIRITFMFGCKRPCFWCWSQEHF